MNVLTVAHHITKLPVHLVMMLVWYESLGILALLISILLKFLTARSKLSSIKLQANQRQYPTTFNMGPEFGTKFQDNNIKEFY